jgi:hypothetical protein
MAEKQLPLHDILATLFSDKLNGCLVDRALSVGPFLCWFHRTYGNPFSVHLHWILIFRIRVNNFREWLGSTLCIRRNYRFDSVIVFQLACLPLLFLERALALSTESTFLLVQTHILLSMLISPYIANPFSVHLHWMESLIFRIRVNDFRELLLGSINALFSLELQFDSINVFQLLLTSDH